MKPVSNIRPEEADALAELVHIALPAAYSRALGREVSPDDRSRLVDRLNAWAARHPVHPADLVAAAERLRRPA